MMGRRWSWLTRHEYARYVVRRVTGHVDALEGYPDGLWSQNRRSDLLPARYFGHWLSGELTKRNWTSLARAWGCDHTTVRRNWHLFEGALARKEVWATRMLSRFLERVTELERAGVAA